jgi:hypothetical protein
VFAGAVRETILSNPKIIEQINSQFVPVAIRAADLNNPGMDAEGQLIRALGRSKILPQGLCVLNSGGQALEWVTTFGNDESVSAFLKQSLQRYKQNPDGKLPNETERYMNYPGQKLESFKEEPCNITNLLKKTDEARSYRNEFVVQLVGRALDNNGNGVANTLQQENYVEHKFTIDKEIEEELAQAAKSNKRFALPERFSLSLVQQAYLGQLDLKPLESVHQAQTQLKKCVFWAERAADGKLHIKGDSEVSMLVPGKPGDGAAFSNEIRLHWTGIAEFDGTNLCKLLVWSTGMETAYWSSPGVSCPATWNKDFALNALPAGHPFNMDGKVAFGFEGTVQKVPYLATAEAEHPNLPQRIKQKIENLHTHMAPWIASGGNPETVSKTMEKVRSLMESARPDEAEKVLDSILSMLNSKVHEPPPVASSPALDLPHRIQQKMGSLQSKVPTLIASGGNQLEISSKMDQVGRLLQSARPDEAEHMLDAIIAQMDSKAK